MTRADLSPKKLQAYTPEQKAKLADKYTSEQLASIEAGEEAVDSKHLAAQATSRMNHWSLKYLDDLSKIDPVVDHPLRAPYSNTDPDQRLKTSDEIDEDLAKFIHEMPPEGSPHAEQAWTDFERNLRLTVGREEAERQPRSAEAPELFRPGERNLRGRIVKGPNIRTDEAKKASKDEDVHPGLIRLMQTTGYTKQQILSLRVKSIIVHRVTNQTRLGKIGKTYMLSVAGNGKGLIGLGEGKSMESAEARLQSQYRAIRNMQPILRYEGRTIFGDVKAKLSATELELYSRPPGLPRLFHGMIWDVSANHFPGFGLRCQQYIWEICRCAGISDLAARVTRSRNPMNTAKATVEALLSQKDPEEVARARGRKMVDVRKVYYAGAV